MELSTASGHVTGQTARWALAKAWALTALVGSLLVWLADFAFYERFGLDASEMPSWSPWSALDLTVQLLAWAAVAALWFWWPRRHVVVAAIAVALVVFGIGARAWAQHEVGRAWGGARVWPAAVLPFQFSARPTTMVPYDREQLPEGVPAHVLLLRYHPDQAVVYDPETHQTSWIGNKIAVPVWRGM